MLVPVVVVRQLGESVLLCFGNMCLLVALVAIALGSIVAQGRPACAAVPAFAPDLTLLGALGAATNVVYSYAGQWMYFELMGAMETPGHFPRAFALTGPIMVAIYLTVAGFALYFAVQEDDILSNMPRGRALRAASALLFAHVMVVYLIKSIVLQQYFHLLCSPSDVDARTPASYLKHGGWGVAMLAFGFLVANAVPFFSQLLGIIGGLLGGPINFLFPLFLFVAAQGRHAAAFPQAGAVESSSSEQSDCSEPTPAGEDISTCAAVIKGLRLLHPAELAVLTITFVFIGATMFLGVADVIQQIVDLDGKFGAPFTCHAFGPAKGAAARPASSCP